VQGWRTMTKLGVVAASRPALTSFFLLGFAAAGAWAGDLSRYRDFQLGTALPAVAKQAGVSPSEATVIHQRPALIQELEWHPHPFGASPKTETAQEVVFTFYNGELFRIAVNYDRYETEGLTTGDLIDAISASYGTATKPTGASKVAEGANGDQDEVLAQWQDPQYRFDLIRSSYGPSFRLVGVLKRLDAPAQAATLEAQRLDDQEAPQRDAARIASEEDAAKTKLEKARLVNKPNFRP
jgi:hypothetical protein